MTLIKKFGFGAFAVSLFAVLAFATISNTAEAAVPTIVDVIFDDADDVLATSANAQSMVVAADVDDGDAGVKGGLTDETNVTLQTNAGFWASNGLTSVTLGCAVDALTIAATSYMDDGVAQLVGISEGTNGATAETAGYPNDAGDTEEATDTTTDDEGCLGVNDTLIVPGGFSGTVTVTAVTSNGMVNSDALTVQAAAAIASVTVGASAPTQIDAAGTVGGDLIVTVRDSTGAIVTGSAVTMTTTLGVIDQLANACVASNPTGDNALTASSDAACTLTTDGTATDSIELFGNGVGGTATVTATTSNGLQATRTVIITGGTVSSLVVETFSDNDATPVTKGIIQNVQSTTTGLDELIIAVRALDSNGNAFIPAGDVTIKVTAPDGTVASGVNISTGTGVIEAGGLTVTTTACSTSADAAGATCIDTIEAGGGGGTNAGAVAFVDVDSTTGIAAGTYTVTATHGTGTAQRTATGTFTVAAVTETIGVVAADSTIEVGEQTVITATVLDASGNPVAQGTTVTFSSSSSVTVLQTPAATGSTVAATTDANGQASVTALALSEGTTQIFATAGGKAGSTTVTVGAGTTPPPPPGACDGSMTAPTFGNGDIGAAVFNGCTIEQLSAAVTAAGGTAVWVQADDGNFRVYSTSGPAFINANFIAAFPDGFPGPTAVTVVK